MVPGYRIERELGRGGMATVHLAVQESLNREVALKLLAPALAADTAFAERFLREAHIAGGFRHRHLIAVYDAGRAGDTLYLAMELVPGGSAAALRGGDPAEIRRCLLEIASALEYAHARGVVHRDLKPDNILRREDGSWVLSDFGIARSGAASSALTGPQTALGTPAYMSPEQWRNDPVDGRADLYALGIVLYELLVGQPPYAGADGWTIGMQHLQAPRPQLPAMHASWQSVLDRLLAIDVAQRYASARELIAALGGPVATPPVTPAGSATVEQPLPAKPPRARTLWLAALAALLACAWAVLRYWPSAQPGPMPAGPAMVAPQGDPSLPRPPAKSVAVLPFRVLSERQEDVYFADGLSEEILTTLAAIAELKVAGRTSSFAWRERSGDLQEIARGLGVVHVLEGSVRRSGEQLRINASLIDARDGSTRWSASFDREVSDAFAIQSEIARAVADRLAVSIGTSTLPTVARLAARERTRYLEAIGLARQARTADLLEVRAVLRELVQNHDVGADCLLRLFSINSDLLRLRLIDAEEAGVEQERILSRIDERFPDTVEALIARAHREHSRASLSQELEHFEAALRLFRNALQRSPNDANVAVQAAHIARAMLKFDEAAELARSAIRNEPDEFAPRWALALTLSDSGEIAQALKLAKEVVQRWPDSAPAWGDHALMLAGSGRIADALLALRDCDRASLVETCHRNHYLWLRLLGLQRAADEKLAEITRADAIAVDSLRALRAAEAGRLPDPRWIHTASNTRAGAASALAGFAVVQEAIAQGDALALSSFLHRMFPVVEWRLDPAMPRALTVRGALPWLMYAQSPAVQQEPALLRAQLAAIDHELSKVPARAFPYQQSALAVLAALLLGDVERAIVRLEALSTMSPLAWEPLLLTSPSGRDLPTAAILRAHPRFQQIQANRDALLARERARIRELRPDLR